MAKLDDFIQKSANRYIKNQNISYVNNKSNNNLDESILEAAQKYIENRKMQIQIRDAQRVNSDKSAFAKFRYDPSWLAVIKAMPERYWNPDTKEWEFPTSQIEWLKETITEDNINIEYLSYDKTIPTDFVFKVKPLPHQKEAIEFGLNHPCFLNSDQQGLGKTYESLMVSEIRRKEEELSHCLILCGVSSLQQNWGKEIEKFIGEKGCIIGRRYTKKGTPKASTNADKIEDLKRIDELPYYLILNIESLRNETIADMLSDYCAYKRINMIIFDEMHKCKNPRSQAGKSFLRLNSKYKIALSGTPIVNNPLDIYLYLRWIGVEGRNFWQFQNYYCIYKEIYLWKQNKKIKIPIGVQHMDEIKRQMNRFMIRRLKKDVLTLPEKIYKTEYLEMGEKQRKIYEEIYRNMLKDVDKIKQSKNPLTHFIRLRQATIDTQLVSSTVSESVKLDRMKDIVEETVNNGEKILIFSNYREPVDRAMEILKKYKPACITADTKDVEKEKKRFKTETDVMIGTIKVMGTGHTLTEATTVLFLDQPWTNADLEQAEDRVHRIGQQHTVQYITLICSGTVDERVNEIVTNKKNMSDIVIDDKYEKNGVSIDYLLSR